MKKVTKGNNSQIIDARVMDLIHDILTRWICRPGYPAVHGNSVSGTHSSDRPVRPDARFVAQSTDWCSHRDMPNVPLELLRGIKRLFRCTAGHLDPANRLRQLLAIFVFYFYFYHRNTDKILKIRIFD